ncbi:MAG: hypothetical protein Q8O00_08550 [Holophaga sp.]|nr:hypothetical protein [Holophaga sp.]
MRSLQGLIIAVCAAANLSAQCSDAGVCALQRMQSNTGNRVGLTYLLGQSGKEDDLRIQTLRLEGQFRVWGEAALSISLPFTSVSGPLGSGSGLSDATLVLDQPLWKSGDLRLAGQIGLRLGTGKSDTKPLLDQRYQPGLGTTDLLLGLRVSIGQSLEMGVGFQKSGGRNDNPITRLERGDDFLLWAEYRREFGSLRAGVKALALKPLGRATVANSAQPGQFQEVPNSDQPQLNVVPFAEMPLTEAVALQVSAALPLLKRDTNVDGLKRSLSVSLGISYRF